MMSDNETQGLLQSVQGNAEEIPSQQQLQLSVQAVSTIVKAGIISERKEESQKGSPSSTKFETHL